MLESFRLEYSFVCLSRIETSIQDYLLIPSIIISQLTFIIILIDNSKRTISINKFLKLFKKQSPINKTLVIYS